ncbi:hypothetical protein ACN38_g8484 [Penicillium nordicum]|uniref:Uncharacterized protein n=1 Tax=Penicillium nordicum TaxID=229535 RepID=A0A0M9WDE6_9EURO|nr:hypothetical protein ACN38_g8484 [Penicillium nordicum]
MLIAIPRIVYPWPGRQPELKSIIALASITITNANHVIQKLTICAQLVAWEPAEARSIHLGNHSFTMAPIQNFSI